MIISAQCSHLKDGDPESKVSQVIAETPKASWWQAHFRICFPVCEASVLFTPLCCLSQMSHDFMYSIQSSASICNHVYTEGFQIISSKLKLV